MAYKVFNATETEYTGTASSDYIVGNSLDNFIDAGEGNNIVSGGGGNDQIYAGSGNDVISGGAGDDVIDAGGGNNVLSGGDGNDFIGSGSGNDVISGGSGDDQIYAGDGNNYIDAGDGNDYVNTGSGNDIISGGSGNDIIDSGDGDDIIDGGEGEDLISAGGATAGDETVVGNLIYVTSSDTALGGEGNDTFVIGEEENATGVTIIGGVSDLDNQGEEARYTDVEDDDGTVYDTVTDTRSEIEDLEVALETETDVRLNIVTRPGSSAISTFATTIAGYNAVDTLEFTKSGEFEEIEFAGIERIELASGVSITLTNEQLEENGESLGREFINPGYQIHGVAGGDVENVTVELEFEEEEFVPAASIVGASPVTYDKAVFEVDDFSVAHIYHNVDVTYDASEGVAGSFTRIDGANEGSDAHEIVQGSEGVDYATMRLGDDTVYGNGGNDLLIGHGGADYLDGGTGDDIFVIGGFGSGVQGTTSKADDGNKEWIATGAKHDVIVGGDGVDTLRITTGIGANTKANGTVVLNNDNFKSMEVVQVGGTVGRLNVENTDLQLLNDHYYFKANGTVADLSNTLGNNGGTINNVVVDASGLTTNGLRFEGNANQQTFIGTSKADVFVGNGGNDTLTGGGGADKFVFGKVYEQVVTGSATSVQTYTNTAFNLTGVDTITDFTRGTDKLELHLDQYSNLAGFNASMLRVNSTGTAQDSNDYLVYNTTTKTLSYDADGNGSGAKVDIAILTGVNTLSTSDFIIV
ncbi:MULTISPECIES: calcium-binding protein [unclassified Methylophilus]|uniref:calcium-binding protein n=1 Tax=unclassified Methylophilus TaxID=2630143 RepID=UPI0006FDFDCD|nr:MULTISPECIES: calcium-binding protein [unclassified Methylophilus]KQT42220.1 calcium-binding protein [Methylophilus sp. Leaf416]KQT56401.1 calcium-binding protein [Methylophilus sp. Leaf459]